MEITDDIVEKMANLARLHIPPEKKESAKNDLQRMVAFVEKLNELDTTGVEPLLHLSKQVNSMREDEVSGQLTQEEALLNAPFKDKEYFKVPRVIQKSGSNK